MVEQEVKELLQKGSDIKFKELLANTKELNPYNILRVICETEYIQETTRCTFALKLLEKYNDIPFSIHLAAEKGLPSLLTTLVNLPKPPDDVKALTSCGETAIISAVRGAVLRKEKGSPNEEAALSCVRFLERKECNIHARDTVTNHFTAVHLAAKHELWLLVKFFLEKRVDIDLQIGGETARDLIQRSHPDWVLNYEHVTAKNENSQDEMVSSLESCQNTEEKEQIFKDWLKDNESELRVNEPCKGGYTLLERAIKNQLPEMACVLVEKEADPNPALLTALEAGEKYFDILTRSKVKLDLSKMVPGKSRHNMLHKAVLSKNPSVNVVDFLLKKGKEQKIENFVQWINARDYNGCTALHYAAKRHLKDMVTVLLRHGANLFVTDYFDLPAFCHIRPELIEAHLDDHVQLIKSQAEDDCAIVFDLGFLHVPRERMEQQKNTRDSYLAVEKEEKKGEEPELSIYPEMDSLRMLADSPNHKRLLQHPVIRAFLQLKWQRLFWFYWLNCGFYLAFTISFFIFVFSIDLKNVSGETTAGNSSTDGNTGTNLLFEHHCFFKWTTVVLTFILALREIFQAIFITNKYFSSWENWLEIFIISLTFCLLVAPLNKALASGLSLLISLEMFLLMSRYPRFANYIHMFLQVASNFIKFLLWYLSLILAFGLSFYIIFPSCQKKDSEESKCNSFFNTVPYAIFKTVIMISGEYESGDLEFDHVSVASHLIFIAFLFFIPIVMVNLLNGLAVSDTQQIKNDAQLIFCTSQAKYFDSIESTLLMTYREDSCCPSVFRSFARWMSTKILLINNLLAKHDNKVTVLLNKNNEVRPEVRLCSGNELGQLLCGCKVLPSGVRKICNTFNTIVRDALQIVNDREEHDNQISARLQRLEDLIQARLPAK